MLRTSEQKPGRAVDGARGVMPLLSAASISVPVGASAAKGEVAQVASSVPSRLALGREASPTWMPPTTASPIRRAAATCAANSSAGVGLL